MNENIVIRGAREHNLKGIDLELPRNKLIVFTGISGSGKSTLAFDTIFAEGQRRYVESLSAYARQFLGVMKKPDVDSIEGLSPAISIDQKTTSKNPRSTVGTVTEIYDYLRLLFARVGVPHCPIHNVRIEKKSPTKIAQEILEKFKGGDVTLYAPVIRDRKGTYEQLFLEFKKDGFTKAVIDGALKDLSEDIELEKYKKHNIDLMVDVVRASEDEFSRIQEAVELALKKGEGLVKANEVLFSENMSCPVCGMVFEELEPRMFSFNTPQGACEECHGIGSLQEIDPELVIPDESKSIIDGAIAVYGRMDLSWRSQQLSVIGRQHGFDIFTPIDKFTKRQKEVLLYGDNTPIKANWSNGAQMNLDEGWEGIIPQTMRLYRQTESDYRRGEIEKYMVERSCPVCKGRRLKEKVLHVMVGGISIMDFTDLSIDNALKFIEGLKLNEKDQEISRLIVKEIKSRLEFLHNVGLSYLTLSRSAGTLSGGEGQRIRLATQLGSNLSGVLYVLDEPSIGLHQRDNSRLVHTLKNLRNLGNTLIVVEHDEETIQSADFVVDIGPGAGNSGGEIVAIGSPKEIMANEKSITGQYLSKSLSINYNKKRRVPKGFVRIKGAKENNLKGIDVDFPLGVMTLVTGVSGSGKSTLVHEILYKGLLKKISKQKITPGKHDEISGFRPIEKIIIIDQSPIGKTPRSNPATYTKLFDEIRILFSQTQEAKIRGYKQGRFSFNVKGGRCERCVGEGLLKIEMNFLPDVYVECDECKGKRYNSETLEVRFKGKNISEVLNLSVDEAITFFENIPKIARKLKVLKEVGLGYIKLGQSSTTLSGGESQRIKLTRELSKKGNSKTLYILDEPTTGLHFHDINNLLKVLNRLVDAGSSMVVIEHNLDMIKNADRVIDLGPEGGDFGGEVIAIGTPEEVSKNKKSYTGKYLKNYLD
ncbi:MAG TPA: excinuclease ABC subunit UvrA [Candidatus Woesearchaeota archaeon]|nr:excinuclease ABC subunit UvrA [Candidatus Woesearchaeota archaeon]